MTSLFTRVIRGSEDISYTDFIWLSLTAMEAPQPPPFAPPARDPLQVAIDSMLMVRVRLRGHRSLRREWNALSREDRRQRLKNLREAYRGFNANFAARNETVLARINPLIRQVTDWDPPEEYLPLQEFMLFSLESGLRSALTEIPPDDTEDLDDDELFEKRQKNRTNWFLAQERILQQELVARIEKIRAIRRYRDRLEQLVGRSTLPIETETQNSRGGDA